MANTASVQIQKQKVQGYQCPIYSRALHSSNIKYVFDLSGGVYLQHDIVHLLQWLSIYNAGRLVLRQICSLNLLIELLQGIFKPYFT